jgi:hypothetical protein
MNGDGFPDLLTANQNEYSVSVLFGRGNGTFGMRRNTNFYAPRALAVSDLDGDGRLAWWLTERRACRSGMAMGRAASIRGSGPKANGSTAR